MASASSYPELRKFLQHADASYHLTDLPVEEIRSSLVEWYAQHRRHLPWRGDAPPYNGSTAGFAQRAAASSAAPASTVGHHTVSAYGVWVSEIMCQQTRVEAVIPYWLTWMEAFPTVEALAAASEDEVNAKWAGLGFYRRARMLHEGAKQVVESHGGELPRDVAGLLSIKGIGPYTAGAVASIVGGVAAPVVDGNVLRVVSRLCAVAATAKEPLLCDEKRGVAWTVARALVEAGGGAEPGALNQALMEVGATYCAPAGSGGPLRAGSFGLTRDTPWTAAKPLNAMTSPLRSRNVLLVELHCSHCRPCSPRAHFAQRRSVSRFLYSPSPYRPSQSTAFAQWPSPPSGPMHQHSFVSCALQLHAFLPVALSSKKKSHEPRLSSTTASVPG